MAKDPTPQPTVWGVLGIMAACFFGLMCFYHVVYWLWLAVAFGADKELAWTRFAIWLVLGIGAGAVWSWLFWRLYFPKNKL
ncbi:MAG TPA: hypothetical protein VL986_15205 [Terracidiphilus sp.]|nr:hypothetical protein [Terracidiphilus sp.]